MKKGFLTMAFFGIMSSCFCQEIYYEVKADTGLFENDQYFLSKRTVQEQRGMIRMMRKGEKVKYTFGDNYSLAGFVDVDPSYIVATDQNGIKGKVIFDDLFLPSNDSLPDKIKNEGWISAYYYEILSGARSLFECEPYWKNEWHTSAGEELHEDVRASGLRISDNAIRMEGYDKSLVYFLITSVKRLPECIEVTAIPEIWRLYSKDIFLNKFKQVDMCTLIIKEDGDYFDMYLDNPTGTPIMTFAIGDRMKVIDKLESIVLGEKIDLTDITFPRHADGTCDYDDKIIKTHKAGGMYKTEDSLRLRAAEGIAGDALATLAAGSRVKVEAIGKEETIDGITANWVWVETLVGAMDKDGNTVETGTEGWLFGGYLSTTEYVEPVKEEKKLNLLDSVETKDERKVNRAVKMNKKEENDDFVFPFIQVGFGIILTIVLLPIILVIAKKKKAGKE